MNEYYLDVDQATDITPLQLQAIIRAILREVWLKKIEGSVLACPKRNNL